MVEEKMIIKIFAWCFVLVVIPLSSAKIVKQLDVQLACNGRLSFYDKHIREFQLVSKNPANISSKYTLNPGTEVLAVKCSTNQGKPWIMGITSNGMVTNTQWKCSSLQEHRSMINRQFWAKPNFDDSHWAQAVANFSNREESPRGKVPDISDDAFWISTADEGDSRLFCRRRLSDVFIKQAKSNGIFQATLDDVDHALSSHLRSQHEVSDVIHCLKKCQDDSQCLSFNFECTSVLPTKKCELNGVTKGQDPKYYVKRPGYTYYENTG